MANAFVDATGNYAQVQTGLRSNLVSLQAQSMFEKVRMDEENKLKSEMRQKELRVGTAMTGLKNAKGDFEINHWTKILDVNYGNIALIVTSIQRDGRCLMN